MKEKKPYRLTQMSVISLEVQDERCKQLEKWGVQDHPSVFSDAGFCNVGFDNMHMCEAYGLPSEDEAKFQCQTAEDKKELTWAHIAVEEMSEAVNAKTPKLMREELVQLAAVVESWIDSIDRNELN